MSLSFREQLLIASVCAPGGSSLTYPEIIRAVDQVARAACAAWGHVYKGTANGACWRCDWTIYGEQLAAPQVQGGTP